MTIATRILNCYLVRCSNINCQLLGRDKQVRTGQRLVETTDMPTTGESSEALNPLLKSSQ